MDSECSPHEDYSQKIRNERDQENIIVPPKSIRAPSMKQSKDRRAKTDGMKECDTDYKVGVSVQERRPKWARVNSLYHVKRF